MKGVQTCTHSNHYTCSAHLLLKRQEILSCRCNEAGGQDLYLCGQAVAPNASCSIPCVFEFCAHSRVCAITFLQSLIVHWRSRGAALAVGSFGGPLPMLAVDVWHTRLQIDVTAAVILHGRRTRARSQRTFKNASRAFGSWRHWK
jgi:hypothetical protein